MCFIPYKSKDKCCTHRLIHPTFIREIVVTADNSAELAKALGIKSSKMLQPGATIHILHEVPGKGPKKGSKLR